MPRISRSDHLVLQAVPLLFIFRRPDYNNNLFSGGHYRISAPGHLPLEAMGHLGICPPGDSLLVLGRWLPPHERGLFKIVELVMDGYTYCGIHLYGISSTMFHL
jgi:hypothetical protein